MKKRLSIILCSILAGFASYAQDPAGNCINNDYEQFVIDGQLRYINCGNDPMFNTGNELTVEVWTRVYDTSWDQKLVGKTNLDFNTGYSIGVIQGRLYPAIWNPVNNTFTEGFMPPLRLWFHLAVTFTAGGDMVGYVNGEEVGRQAAPAAPIVDNTDDMIMFIAPWGNNDAFMAFGEFDEVRVWNRALSGDEVRENIHRTLTGSENGLIAYYDFNEASGNTVNDLTGNGNDGTFQGAMSDENRTNSRAVMGDETAGQHEDLRGVWNGVTLSDPRFVSTDNGLSVTASNIPEQDYVVFGHNGGTGVSTADLATGVPANFSRTERSWYLNVVGAITADLAFDLGNASAGGSALDESQLTENYTLLWRPDANSNFTSLGSANLLTNGVVLFQDVELFNGHYAIGVGDAVYVGTEERVETAVRLEIFPNPSTEDVQFRIHNTNTAQLQIIDALGAVVYEKTLSSNGTSRAITVTASLDLPAGTYFVRLAGDTQVLTEVLVRQ